MSDNLKQHVYLYPIDEVLAGKIDDLDAINKEPQELVLNKLDEGGFKKIFEIVGTDWVLASYINDKVSHEETISYVKRFLLTLKTLREKSTQNNDFQILKNSFCFPVAIFKSVRTGRWGFIYPKIPQSFTRPPYSCDSYRFANPRSFESVFCGESFITFLIIALKMAILFTWLHRYDIVYGDISYNNILVDDKNANVYIIDTDGMHNTSEQPGEIVGSPYFEVPEVIVGSANHHPLSAEQFCFYIFTYSILMHRHPLRGTQQIPGGLAKEEMIKYLYGTHPVFFETPGCSEKELKSFLYKEYKTANKWSDPVQFSAVNVLGDKLASHLKKCFHARPEDRPEVSSFLLIYHETFNLLRPCPDLSCDLGWHVTPPKFQSSVKQVCPDCRTEFKNNRFFHIYFCNDNQASYSKLSLSIYNYRSLYPWDFSSKKSFIPHIMGNQTTARSACIISDEDNNFSILNLSDEPVHVGHTAGFLIRGTVLNLQKGKYVRLKHGDVIWQGEFAQCNLLFADFHDSCSCPDHLSLPNQWSFANDRVQKWSGKNLQPYLDYFDVWGHCEVHHPDSGSIHYYKVCQYLDDDREFDLHKDDIIHHLRISAHLGFARAQAKLGRCYLYGKGLSKNKTRGLELLHTAALKNSDAIPDIADILVRDPRNQEIIAILEVSANNGNVQTANFLGGFFEDENLPLHDLSQAIKWYELAAMKNCEDSKKALERVRKAFYKKKNTIPASYPGYPADNSGIAAQKKSDNAPNNIGTGTSSGTVASGAGTSTSGSYGNSGTQQNTGTSQGGNAFPRSLAAFISAILFVLSLSFAWIPVKKILSLIWEWLLQGYSSDRPPIYGFGADPPTCHFAWYDWIVYVLVAVFFAFLSIILNQRDESLNDQPLNRNDWKLCKKCLILWLCYIFANPICFLPCLIFIWFFSISSRHSFFSIMTAIFASIVFVFASLLSLYIMYRVIVQEKLFLIRRIGCALLCIPMLVFIGYAKMTFLFGWAGFPYYLMWLLFPGITRFFFH